MLSLWIADGRTDKYEACTWFARLKVACNIGQLRDKMLILLLSDSLSANLWNSSMAELSEWRAICNGSSVASMAGRIFCHTLHCIRCVNWCHSCGGHLSLGAATLIQLVCQAESRRWEHVNIRVQLCGIKQKAYVHMLPTSVRSRGTVGVWTALGGGASTTLRHMPHGAIICYHLFYILRLLNSLSALCPWHFGLCFLGRTGQDESWLASLVMQHLAFQNMSLVAHRRGACLGWDVVVIWRCINVHE